MALGEIYIKLAVNFADDPKVRALARYGAPDAGLARDLFIQMICHCKEMLTDGFVSAEQVGLMVYPLDPEHGNQLAKQLASVGLIKEESKNEAPGWQVLAYVKRNGTREDVERLSRVRAEAGRKGGRPPGHRPSKANRNQIAKQTKSRPNPYTETESETESVIEQAPTVPAADAAGTARGLTVTQRSKRLTDAYAEAEPLCKWPAVNAVVIRAIKSEKFTDDEIKAALLRLAAGNRSVTVDTLRTELQGFPLAPPGRAASPKKTSYSDEEYASGWG
jgi:hypothetical protein